MVQLTYLWHNIYCLLSCRLHALLSKRKHEVRPNLLSQWPAASRIFTWRGVAHARVLGWRGRWATTTAPLPTRRALCLMRGAGWGRYRAAFCSLGSVAPPGSQCQRLHATKAHCCGGHPHYGWVAWGYDTSYLQWPTHPQSKTNVSSAGSYCFWQEYFVRSIIVFLYYSVVWLYLSSLYMFILF